MGLWAALTSPALEAVQRVDVTKMLGKWFVVAVLPTPFEKGACNPTEVYSWNEEEALIDVSFTFNKGSLDGPLKSIPQKIFVPNFPTCKGKWLASPFWPLKLDYTIMSLADDYSWVVVGHSSRLYFWVMSRQTSLDDKVLEQAIQLGTERGFDMSGLERPAHN